MKPEDLTIFIVDDDASILRSVKRLMRSAGYRKVEIFASTEDFLSGMVPKEPCLLISLIHYILIVQSIQFHIHRVDFAVEFERSPIGIIGRDR
jgi:FixJ family two-component response regulator